MRKKPSPTALPQKEYGLDKCLDKGVEHRPVQIQMQHFSRQNGVYERMRAVFRLRNGQFSNTETLRVALPFPGFEHSINLSLKPDALLLSNFEVALPCEASLQGILRSIDKTVPLALLRLH